MPMWQKDTINKAPSFVGRVFSFKSVGVDGTTSGSSSNYGEITISGGILKEGKLVVTLYGMKSSSYYATVIGKYRIYINGNLEAEEDLETTWDDTNDNLINYNSYYLTVDKIPLRKHVKLIDLSNYDLNNDITVRVEVYLSVNRSSSGDYVRAVVIEPIVIGW